jgi:hypothetical protein
MLDGIHEDRYPGQEQEQSLMGALDRMYLKNTEASLDGFGRERKQR